MFNGPFKFLAAILIGPILVPIFFPLSVLLGYPALLLVAIWMGVRWSTGRVEQRPVEAATWLTYLGLILMIHGIILGADIALAGAPPSDSEKLFGARLAYLGATVATLSVVAAYGLDWQRRTTRKRTMKLNSVGFDDEPGL